MKKEINIAVIGLGYVGLPLFCLLSKYFPCIGIDKDTVRVTQLKMELIIENVKISIT